MPDPRSLEPKRRQTNEDQVLDAIIIITNKAFHQNLQVMFKLLLPLKGTFLIKEKSERDDFPLNL